MYKIPLTPYSKIFYNEWKLDQNRNDYNIVFDQNLSGLLEIQRLNDAIKRFISDYIIFNSHIDNKDKDLYWVENDTIHEIDFFEKKIPNSKILSYIQKPFDLETGPLYRFGLVKVNNNNYRLIIVLHHIVIDGQTMDYFIQELSNYYNNKFCKSDASKEEQLSKITKLSIELSEYVYLNKEKSKSFWKEKLKGIEPIDLRFLKLNKNKILNDNLEIQSLSEVGEIRFSFDKEIFFKLNKLKKKYEVTPYLYGKSIIAILLNKYSGKNSFCISYPIAINEGANFIHGAHINTIMIPYDFSTISTILDIFNQTKKFIKALRPNGINHSYLPIFNIISALNKDVLNISFSQTNLKDKTLEFVNVESKVNYSTNIDLVNDVLFEQEVRNEEINYRIKYKLDRIEISLLKEFIESYKRLFTEILEELINIKNIKNLNYIKGYNLLSNEQYTQIVYTWNDTGKEYPCDKTIHGLFEEQVERSPDSIALVCEGIHLSYRKVNERANKLAHYIRSREEIESDTLIALCLDRSEHMLISILAVLKAGGAYVPMDPGYPDSRIEYIVNDTRAKVLLTNIIYQERIDGIDKGANTSVIAVDSAEVQEALVTASIFYPVTRTESTNLAYVIYTSGTTGNPKGVMIGHRGVVNTIASLNDVYDLKKGNKITAFTSYIFDVSVSEFFTALFRCGEIHLLNDAIRSDSYLISSYIRKNNINYVYLPPILLSNLPKVKYKALYGIIYAGEPCDINTGEYWSNHYKLYNYYGPTEVTIYASGKKIKNGDTNLIGKPISNTNVYILDNNLTPLPIGAIGELYVGGVGLARGYLNRADLTAEKFIANPFRTEEELRQGKNARLYRTGDLARLLPDGNLEYIGRNDSQVKIRGYRIELGEIESALLSYEDIKQSVVVTREYVSADDSTGNKYLVGYYVSEHKLKESDILTYLESKLPEYMVPSTLVHLEKLPLTINGKLDRKALPDTEFTDKDNYLAPRNELEAKVCQIWAEVLGIEVDKVGIHDNFFRLGGNSILAIRLVSKLGKELNRNVSIASIFKSHSIERLIEYLKGNAESGTNISKVSISNAEKQKLSFAQERLWFIEKYEEGTNAYNIPMLYKLSADINLDTLEMSLKAVVARHEILRTLIKENTEGLGYQLVLDNTKNLLEINKISITSKIELETELQKAVNYVYDLSNEIPIRVCFYYLQPNKEYYTSIVVHHIAFDGWSTNIFFNELQEYYNYYLAKLKGFEAKLNLPDITIQYRDFALWQRNYLSGDRLDSQLNYWRSKLENYETLNLVTDKQRLKQVNYSGKNIYFEIDKGVSISLRELAKELKVSLYSVLLSAYYLMLRVYSNQDDIVIGTAVSNRHYNKVESLIGFFVNTIVLRTQIRSTSTIKEFIETVSKEVIEAQLHQDLPFEKLVEELQVEKDTSRHPIFQVMFGLQNFGFNTKSELLQGYVSDTNLYNVAKFDIETFIDDSQEILRGGFNYAVSLYTEETINRLKDTYLEIVKQISNCQVEEKISDIGYLNKEEYERIVYGWNDTGKEYPCDKTIHRLFEEQVEKSPDSIALVYEDIHLSYREVNERANKLAHYIRSREEIEPDTLIALCLDRSEHMLISILAVLKAGGAYVPMDPGYPDSRIEYIVNDTRAKVLLTNSVYQERLDGIDKGANTNVIAVDSAEVQEALVTASIFSPVTRTESTNLAYVIYTSGTTGNPKGVLQLHSNIIRLLTATHEWYKFNHNDVWTLFHSYIFDFSVWEIWGAFNYGGKLIILSNEKSRDLNIFYELCQQQKVTVLNHTPTAFYQFADIVISNNKLTSFRYIIFGGETLNLEQLKGWFEYYSDDTQKLINMYGITETTVHVTYKQLKENGINNNSDIGKLIPDLKAYILDNNLTPLPIGAIGELYVGGVGLARGYLNRADLTAEKFIANPFRTEEELRQGKNARLYRTGDLARLLPDGNLEYIGRNDSQVKIRGYRIELGEIESALLLYEGIKQSVVVAQEHVSADDSTGNKYLVGYYVSDHKLKEPDILTYLGSKLPEYMVPSTLVHLEKLPLTINGKLDRKALPDPEFTDKDNYLAPRNELEAKMCQIWSEVLGIEVERVGIRDDFFRLGGDSILAIRLVSKVNIEFKSGVKVRDIFKLKCISNLAETIFTTNNDGQAISYVPFNLVNIEDYKDIISNFELIEDVYPASYLQIGMLLESNMDDKSTYHNISNYLISTKYDEYKFLSIWKSLVDKHELLRAAFVLNDNGWNVIIHKDSKLDYQLYKNRNIVDIVTQEKRNSFDYNKPGLFRLIVNDLGNSFDFIHSFHHVIEDGWSVASLINEFIQTYVNDKPIIPIPDLRYGEFVQNEILAIEDQGNATFWKEYLDNYNVTKVNWKFDKLTSEDSLYNKSINLSTEQVTLIHRLAKDLVISIDSIFLLAYLETLSFFTNNTDMIVGQVVNNRLEKEGGDKLFGLFLNTIPFRFNINNISNYSSKLLEVFTTKVRLQQYKHLPYGYIKSLFKQELYDFAFNFIHFHIFDDSYSNLQSLGGYERTNIPFVLSVSQYKESMFLVKFSVHDNYISQDFLDYFTVYYQESLLNILNNPGGTKLRLTEQDYKQIVYDWNNTGKEYPCDKTIHRLFEEQVERSPDSIALVYEDIHLSYREVNERANKLAHYIRSREEIEPDTLIALCLDRSEHMLISILAVLKAGGAYVPMDPGYPDSRIEYIVNDTRAKVLLTNSVYQERLDGIDKGANTNVIAVDSAEVQEALVTESIFSPVTRTESTNLAYVIYTSGTTGNPKGVMIGHKGITNLVTLQGEELGLTDAKKSKNCLWYANYVFDAHVWEIYSTICNGNTIYVINNNIRQDISLLSGYIEDNAIDIALLPPILLNNNDILKLDTLIIGGDTIDKKLLSCYQNNNLTIINAYGPTEITVYTSLKHYNSRFSREIGKPISNTKVYILDNNLTPLPIGAIGELYVGGVGLARGYLNRADLTAEKFIANPFRTEEELRQGKNARLYRTGDLARLLPDGNLEYIGRNDSQVKIRGYRIELGEIESALLLYEGIKQSVVVAREHVSADDSTGNKYLVGYYVSENKLKESDILTYLGSKLPEYMVPSTLVHLEKLPLTINGKLDRKALPDTEFTDKDNYLAPRNELEAKVCQIWAEVLGIEVDKVGIHDNFFRLGGNSILAIRLVSKLGKELNRNVSIASIFKSHSIERLIEYLKGNAESGTNISKVSISNAEKQKLSFAQERLWFIEKYEEGTNAYNIPMLYKLSADINLDTLEMSLKAVVARHEILRTLIKENTEGLGYQLVLDNTKDLLEINKISITSKIELETELQKAVNYVYDLSNEIPIRVCFYYLQPNKEYYTSIVVHHIAFDGWSTNIFFNELQEYYNYYLAKLKGLEAKLNLPDITIQYRDFALWQRNYLSGDRLDSQLNYWRSKLENYDTLSLVTDKQRLKQVNYSGKNIYFEIDKGVSISLRELAKGLKVSLYSVLLSAYYLMLRVYSNQDDIVIGTAVSNRHYNQVESLIGFFVNTIVLRTQIRSTSTIKEFIETVSKEVIEAQLHQDLPFEKLVEELQVEKDTSRHPIFQVMFGLQNFGFNTKSELLQGYVSDTNLYNVAKFDIETFIDDSQEILRGGFNYAVSLYTEETINRLKDAYLEIVKQISNCQVEEKISDIGYLNKEEYERIVYGWNDTGKEYPCDKTIHGLFEEQVERSPDSIALVYEDIHLSYREVNERANKLAHYIRSREEIEPDTLIALCLDRSEHMLISILAVLKAGGAYVPVDPGYPDSRIEYIVNDTRAKVLLTNSVYQERLDGIDKGANTNVIAVDSAEVQEALVTASIFSPVTRTESANLAYVIYTSGTTGNPKGVMIGHKGITNLVTLQGEELGLTDAKKSKNCLWYANYVFDAHVWEIYSTICNGNTIYVINNNIRQDISLLSGYIEDNAIDIALLPPILLNNNDILKLDTLIIGGDTIDKKLLSCYQNNNLTIINAYGPTEITVYTSLKHYNSRFSREIGKPISNTKVYILDNNLTPLPIGAIGELYVGGVGLARGYLNRADLTAEKFIANPFRTEEELRQGKNARLYRTGDLARLLPDGNLEYIGRNDSQVKIRGYRIELGEIESALLLYEGIKQSVVVAREHVSADDSTGNKYLVGYYVSENKLKESDILTYLGSKLPEYMVPSTLVHLEKLPLTINGKLDRKALPDTEFTDKDNYLAPRNELEAKVCQIWAEVLGIEVDKVGIHDNFFRLGGNSILAIRLVSKLGKELNRNVSIASIFKSHSIERLIEYLKGNVESGANISKVSISNAEKQKLSFAQERLWFIEKYEEGTNAYNIPMLYKLSADINLDILEMSIKAVVARHEILRTLIKENTEGLGYQLVLDNTKNLLEINKISITSKIELEKELQKAVNYVYDLSNEIPIRVCFYYLQPNKEYYTSIVVHHIAFDEWSTNIFFSELQEYYNYYLAKSKGLEAKLNLPDITIQYRDFALWQRNYLSGDRLDSQLNYWRSKLENYETLNLVTDKQRLKQVNYSGKNIYFEIDKGVSISLRELAKGLKVSLYSVLLSAYYLMLRVYSNQDDIVIGTAVSNRHYNQVESLIGFFVNTIVLRTQIRSTSTIKEFIETVSKEVIEAQLHQDLPFEKLVEELQVEKDTSRHPIFQVMFGLQNFGFNTKSELLQGYVSDTNLYNVAKFDIETFIDDSQEILRGGFNYAVSLYTEETINRLKDTYLEIVKQISNCQVEEKISDIGYLNKEEYERIVYGWNDTGKEYPCDKTIHGLFEEQVERSPDSIALVYEDIHLSYREVNERANKLAHYIRSREEIEPDTLIALCLDRSEHMLISILAVLKAGGAYVPVDPGYPDSRIEYIVNDTRAKVLLTNSVYQERLDGIDKGANTNVIAVDSAEVQEALVTASIFSPVTRTESANLAYVIYTSGTTGNPKGVMIGHKGITNLVTLQGEELGLTDAKKSKNCLWYANYVFDAHVWEIYSTICNGNTIYVINNNIRQDISLLSGYIEDNAIDIALLPPILLNNNDILKLDTLIIGGDTIDKKLLSCYQNNNLTIINAYGPTEITVYTSLKHYNSRFSREIGKPISNTKVYILDNNLTPLPIGAIGELYVGGVGLARGYLNRADLTAEKFIANPFRTEEELRQGKNARLYRTGDLARLLPDGNLEYIGRNDSQVKIRGYRIELGEIESALLLYEGIKQSVVVAREHVSADDSTGNKYLVGYYVSENKLKESDILTYLGSKLPEYMVPSTLVHLEKLPLTINGKLDRKALPDTEFTDKDNYLAPRNELEAKVCQIWAEVLGIEVDKVGIHDNFFRLGGNSILAIRLVSKLGKELNRNVSIANIFKSHSIERLIEYLKGNAESGTNISKVSISNAEKQKLSFAQERLWFIEKYEEGTNAYNIPMLYKLSADINLDTLEMSLKAVVARHEILRTLIKENTEGLGYQLVLDNTKNLLEINKISITSKIELETELQKAVNYVYDLSNEIPIRVCFYYLQPNKEYYTSIVVHHIAFDGWSTNIFFSELQEYYNYYLAKLKGFEAKLNLPDITIQYRDFALWQRNYLSGDRLDSQLNYWRSKLENYETLNLVTDKQRLKQVNYSGKNIYFEIDKGVSISLRELAKELKVSLYSVLLSAYYLMLRVYSNQDDIVIGTAVSNRHYNQVESLIGFFVNTIVLRTQIRSTSTIKEFIETVSKEVIEAQLHQDLPFEKLVEELQVEKDTSRHPIFQVMFGLQNFGFNTKSELLQGYVSDTNLYNVAKFDIETFIDDSQEILRGGFNYAVSLYTEETINRLKDTYLEIVKQISNCQVEEKISDIGYLNKEEYERIVYGWNDTGKEYPCDKTIHGLFEEQVERSPDSIALVYEDIHLSYREVNERANKLAHYIRSREEVEPDTLIALCLDRSEHMLISILAVLKAGGAYVPMDPGYPDSRIEYIVNDTRAKVLLTNSVYQERLDGIDKGANTNVIAVDSAEVQEALVIASIFSPVTRIESANLAYVIYTSGTTGNPKGVMIGHRGVVCFCFENNYLFMNSNTAVLGYSNYVFDGSIFDIFSTLLTGGKLILSNKDVILNEFELYNILTQHSINTLFITTVLFSYYSKLKDANPLNHLSNILFGGEKLNINDLEEFLSTNNTTNLIHVYGPTENIVFSTYYNVILNDKIIASIGKKLLDKTLYILSTNLTPLPIGAIGELYVGGVGLARGYLNRADLTAEKFIANPFRTEEELRQGKNARLYRTGDLARLLPDGNLEYIGRNDSQVKIRGYRIELGEIESALLLYEGIKQSVVVAREHVSADDSTGNKYLVGYYVSEHKLKESDILTYLESKLPEYMVPSTLVHLEKLPLTINGKLDRKALPDTEFTDKDNYLAPRNELEAKVCQIWAEVLGIEVDKVGIHDNFFRLGGNSILAIRLVSKLGKELNRNISIGSIFKSHSIERLIEYLKDNAESGTNISKVSISNAEKQKLSFAQERLWFIEKYEEGTNAYNIPMLYKLSADINLDTLEMSLKAVVARHEILRTLIKENTEGLGYQLVLDNTKNLLEINKISITSKIELETELQKAVNYVYDLSNEIPIRVCFYYLQPNKEYYTSIVVHHIAFDGWSTNIFFNELQEYYNYYLAKLKGLEAKLNLPDITIQYRDFALWQRNYLSGDRLDSQLNYWRSKLENYETLNLVTDKQRLKQVNYSGKNIYFEIDKGVSISLRELAKELKVSLYSVLLSAYYLMLRVYSNQDDIVIGTAVSNRHYNQVESLIGFFVNTIVLRTQIRSTSTIKEFIETVSKEVIEAQLHQDLPFEKLVEELQVEKDTSRHPIFQVMFGLQNFGFNTKSELLQGYVSDTNLYNVAKFDIETFIDDSQEILRGGFNYAVSLYTEETINRLKDTYLEIVKQISNCQVEEKISDIGYLNKEEYERIVYGWNDTGKEYPCDKTIHRLFEEQVEKSPDSIALVYEDIHLSYREVNERANKLAHYIRSREEIEPDTLIALCLDRSEHMLISILAVLKAGGAYVPMDPGYPDSRIEYIVNDTRAKVLLTNSVYQERLDGIDKGANTNVIAVDSAEVQEALVTASIFSPVTRTESTNLAYVIYTSGTTGNPKGVMIGHRGVVNTIASLNDVYDLKKGNKITAFTSYIFDVSVSEFFTALFRCGEIHLLNDAIRSDSYLISSYVRKNNINYVYLPPILLSNLPKVKYKALCGIIYAGEPCDINTGEYWSNHYKLYNYYGPTEVTIYASGKKIKNGDTNLIGKPISNTNVYILDNNLTPLPIGAIGELYVGGVGLARGYLNRADLTAEKFIANPFRTEEELRQGKNARLYRTGDLARLLPDGNRNI